MVPPGLCSAAWHDRSALSSKGALYHVTSHGDRPEAIQEGDADGLRFRGVFAEEVRGCSARNSNRSLCGIVYRLI